MSDKTGQCCSCGGRWFKLDKVVLYFITRVPLGSKTLLCISESGGARLAKLNQPVMLGVPYTCFIAGGKLEARSEGYFYVLELERVHRENETCEKKSVELPCRPRAVPILVDRKTYLEMVKAIFEYLKNSQEVEKKIMSEIEVKFNIAYPKLLAIRTLEEVGKSDNELVLITSAKSNQQSRGRNQYTPFLLIVRKLDFKIFIQKIAEIAGVKYGKGKKRDIPKNLNKKPDGAVLIFLDKITTQNRAAYQKLLNIVAHLEREDKAKRLLPRVYLIWDIDLAEQLKHIFTNLYKLNLLLTKMYLEDNTGVIDYVIRSTNK